MNSCESLLEHEEDASMRDISKKGKVKVLVADDQTMISKLLQRLTRACSDATVTVDCDCVEDGEDMVHYVKDCLDRSIDCPDVIVSDLHMLKMNGDAAITAVQKLCRERGVRAPYCVILSGDESRETFEAGERCGAHEVRIKPMKKEHLKEIIECAHLGRQTWKCT
jgi:DNA-binding NarL/FixJ family response regulator